MNYDNWKLATPPEYDEPGDELDLECENAEEYDDTGDSDYEWERPALSELMDDEIDTVTP